MGHSVLLITVPELEGLVRPPIERWAPDYLHHEPNAVYAHITLLAPFVGRDQVGATLLDELGELFGAVEPFDFVLSRLDRFPDDGLVHLLPSPAGPFRRLTKALHARYPEHPPYGGAFGEVVPHLSIDHAESTEELADLVAPYVPVTARATAAHLYWYEPHQSCSLARFPFADFT